MAVRKDNVISMMLRVEVEVLGIEPSNVWFVVNHTDHTAKSEMQLFPNFVL